MLRQATLDFDRPMSVSEEAAHRHEASGDAQTNREIVLDAVIANPGKTSGELWRITGMDLTELRRRLNDLKNECRVIKGETRKCTVLTKSRMHTWTESPTLGENK